MKKLYICFSFKKWQKTRKKAVCYQKEKHYTCDYQIDTFYF